MSDYDANLPLRAAQTVALCLTFTAGAGCSPRTSDGGDDGGGSGGKYGAEDLPDLLEESTRLQCECYVSSDYSYYDTVEECIEGMNSYGIPDDCALEVYGSTQKGREFMSCMADVVAKFNICIEKNGCSEDGYDYGVPRRCHLEQQLDAYDCFEEAGGYDAWYYEIYEQVYEACYEDGYYGGSSPGSPGTGGYGGPIPDPFTCTNGETIPGDWQCDFEVDCTDGSDEVSCESFTCGDGETIPPAWECDGEFDCDDESDEENCMSRPKRRPDMSLMKQLRAKSLPVDPARQAQGVATGADDPTLP